MDLLPREVKWFGQDYTNPVADEKYNVDRKQKFPELSPCFHSSQLLNIFLAKRSNICH